MQSAISAAAGGCSCLPVWAAEDDVNPDEIIQKFAAKEAGVRRRRATTTPTGKRVKFEELDAERQPDRREVGTGGRHHLLAGRQAHGKVVYAPVVSLLHILLTPEDEQDLRDVQPFVLTTPDIPEYDIQYLGKEKVDEIGCYAFAVKPKKMVKGKRYFEGQIWVDDRDLQIVKTYGKGVGIINKGDEPVPEVRNLSGADRRQVLVSRPTPADDTLHL